MTCDDQDDIIYTFDKNSIRQSICRILPDKISGGLGFLGVALNLVIFSYSSGFLTVKNLYGGELVKPHPQIRPLY